MGVRQKPKGKRKYLIVVVATIISPKIAKTPKLDNMEKYSKLNFMYRILVP